MSTRRLKQAIYSIARAIGKIYRGMTKGLLRWLLRNARALTRQASPSKAGFVLPTVTMVILVVVLIVTAIMIRSFDRANNARNTRVNQVVLSAAKPALERASAKLNYLLTADPTMPVATPSDDVLSKALENPLSGTDRYTFGDEERLILKADINGDNTPQPNGEANSRQDDFILEDNEEITTAWRFPVDTDNNGKYDTYSLYGIYFRSPLRDSKTGKFTTARSTLDARTPPMAPVKGTNNKQCIAALGTSAQLVGDSGWYQSDGKLKKSFFVFTANVPIHAEDIKDKNKYEESKSRGFSAIEYQQDRTRIPLTNNAVVYEDDLEVSPGPKFRLNGRMFTNSNLVVTNLGGNGLTFFQVSSKDSCYYKEENSKIIAAGNVVNGWSGGDANRGNVGVHLFKSGEDPDQSQTITTSNQSVSQGALSVIYNNKAYSQRIAMLVQAQINKDASGNSDPTSVKEKLAANTDATKKEKVRRDALEAYFRERTRKVPFAEVGLNASATDPYNATGTVPILGDGDSLRPVDDWMFPTTGDAKVGATSGPTKLTLNPKMPPATELKEQDEADAEPLLGDRVLAGNNLPALRWDGDKAFLGDETPQKVDGSATWDKPDGTKELRVRTTRVTQLADVGATDRDGFWEKMAATQPEAALDGIGGLRVVTGAGVYERLNSFLPPPAVEAPPTYDDPATSVEEKYPIVWPDTMPMSPGVGSKVYNNKSSGTDPWETLLAIPTLAANPPETPTIDTYTPKYAKGDLRMRATAVYHYANDPIDSGDNPKDYQQAPIACVSSYYDPTDSKTARNPDPLPDVSGGQPPTYAATGSRNDGKSNNGVVYPAPTTAIPTSATKDAKGLFTVTGTAQQVELGKQANYVFPDGRFANQPLRDALQRLADGGKLTIAEQSAIDSTLCSLDILAKKILPLGGSGVIPHGAIRETAFLNGREVKAVDANTTTTTVDETFTLSSPLSPNPQSAKLSGLYDLSLEERQPLEIRVTQLDLNQLRNKSISFTGGINGPSPEYLLPNSGIIYATRDDALPDRSDRSKNAADENLDEEKSKLVSPTDSLVDPTRRPNGIMLINGQRLARNDKNNNGHNDIDPADVSDVVKEKGLTLVSNLPVYIQGKFNPHTKQEFTADLEENNWSNFYSRTGLNPDFACRPKDPRLPKCTTGDEWRPATVLADAVTVLSDSFRPGFRNEGDFDLRNNAGNGAIVGYDANGNLTIGNEPVNESEVGDLNGDSDTSDSFKEREITAAGARKLNGFFANNFVTNGLSSGATFDVSGTATLPPYTDGNYSTAGNAANSSYFNNFVTPVQRRGNYPEYVMEICRKLPVSSCGPDDWVVGKDSNSNGKLDDDAEKKVKANALGTDTKFTQLGAGTTVKPPIDQNDQRYPRRVAFLRNPNNTLVLDANKPIPIGVKDPDHISCYSAALLNFSGPTALACTTGGVPRSIDNSLRYKTTGTAATLVYQQTSFPAVTVQQPLLVPILQIHVPAGTGDPPTTPKSANPNDTRWLPKATATTFNLVVGSGDIPSRAMSGTIGDTNGGLQNLPRFLENWNGTKATMFGSFIQLNRSRYAVAPYQPLLDSTVKSVSDSSRSGISGSTDKPPFKYLQNYTTQVSNSKIPYFAPPDRNWGFDVGLLSQPPDLFAQKFTLPPSKTNPDEFYREVSRDDLWVKTLLCALVDKDGKPPAVNDSERPSKCFN